MAQAKANSRRVDELLVRIGVLIIACGSAGVAALVGARGAAAATSRAQVDEEPADLLIALRLDRPHWSDSRDEIT